MADPDIVAKVRPVLILSVDYRDEERAVRRGRRLASAASGLDYDYEYD